MRIIRYLTIIFVVLSLFLFYLSSTVSAQFYPIPGSSLITPMVTPEPCASGQGHIPKPQRQPSYCPDLAASDDKVSSEDSQAYTRNCATSFEAWLADKEKNFWVEDPEVTALGQQGERSRQFLLWTLTHQSIDDIPSLLSVWELSRNVAMFLILLVVIIMGIGIIVSQRNNFNLSIEVSPLIIRVALLLLFLVFSARIVLILIQTADIMMEFFIRNLNVRELFNLFLVDDPSKDVLQVSERAYREFVGCTNWSTRAVDSARTSKFLVRFTNMTYYFIGIMMILRKVVLWFLLVVSPFLVILAPFVFIRNIGWIWIGVFFQWAFYGPLMALFLGTLAQIWNTVPVHIPYVFDFSRINRLNQVVYPTSTNILYGGPAQTLGILNTSNYVDTFAEYVISLIMLWTVIILPWWLLRIFRDYCCDGIYSMKNILLSMYDTMRTGPTPPPSGGPTTPRPTGTASTALKMPKKIDSEVTTKVKLETAQDIQRATTDKIVQSIEIRASNIAEVAQMETNDRARENAARNLDRIQNPFKAETPTERQKLMNLRDEIQTRAQKGDDMARNLSAITSRSSVQQQIAKQKILQTMPKMIPVIHTISIKFNLPQEKARNIVRSIFNAISNDEQVVTNIASETKLSTDVTRKVLQTVARGDRLERPTDVLIRETAKETDVEENQVKQVIAKTVVAVKEKKDIAKKVAQQEEVEQETVEKVVQEHLPAVSEPEKHIETQIPASEKVSIEDYEEVKGMWVQQYEKGEVPVTENVKTRPEWVEKDVVRISNILNKVLSSDKKLQEQGLDEVGYILPIFMVNNLSGEELLVYLKAKLEAAKQVQQAMVKEQEMRAKIKEEEEVVEIETPQKKQAAKEQVLSRGLEIDGEEKGETKEEDKNQQTEMSEIKKKIEDELEKSAK